MGHAHASQVARAHSLTGVATLDIFGRSEAFGLADIHVKAKPVAGPRAIITIYSARPGLAIGDCRCLSDNFSVNAVLDAMWQSRRSASAPTLVADGVAEQRLYGSGREG